MVQSSAAIRRLFLSFFAKRGHAPTPGAPLAAPANDGLLFTVAGMQQFRAELAQERSAPPAATAQRCVRVRGKHNDIGEVGATGRHLSGFEMMGSFVFGGPKDSTRAAAAANVVDFLSASPDGLQLPMGRLRFSVLTGDAEARRALVRAGAPDGAIIELGEAENFWAAGPTGPCGPSAEVHWAPHELGDGPEAPGEWLELWNTVMVDRVRDGRGGVRWLDGLSIDTGAGLERLAAVVQGVPSVFDTDGMRPIRDAARALGVGGVVEANVVADHARALAWMLAEGVRPGADGRGYVLRSMLRRAVRIAKADAPFLHQLLPAVTAASGGDEALRAAEATSAAILRGEEERFGATLAQAMAVFEGEAGSSGAVSAKLAFLLHDTYGFPLEMTAELAGERGMALDRAGFDVLMEEQRLRARAARSGEGVLLQAAAAAAEAKAKTAFVNTLEEVESRVLVADTASGRVVLDTSPFYARGGGQVGDRGVIRDGAQSFAVVDAVKSGGATLIAVDGDTLPDVGTVVVAQTDSATRRRTRAHHTATHLLHAALREVLGDGVSQAGSHVDADGLRFDFTHEGGKLSASELEAVKARVNEWVADGRGVSVDEMPLRDARGLNAVAQFGDVYGGEDDVVRVVTVPGASTELCGGTHAESTTEIFPFLLVGSDQATGAGTRRLRALAGPAAVAHMDAEAGALRDQLAAAEKKAKEHKRERTALARTLAQAMPTEPAEWREDGTVAVHKIAADAPAEFLLPRCDHLRAEVPGVTHVLVQGRTVAATGGPADAVRERLVRYAESRGGGDIGRGNRVVRGKLNSA